MERRLVTRHGSNDLMYALDGAKLEDALESIREAFAEVPEAFKDSARLDQFSESYAYDENEYKRIKVAWSEPENDEEYNKRLAQEAEWKERRRQDFERMKKEFGE